MKDSESFDIECRLLEVLPVVTGTKVVNVNMLRRGKYLHVVNAELRSEDVNYIYEVGLLASAPYVEQVALRDGVIVVWFFGIVFQWDHPTRKMLPLVGHGEVSPVICPAYDSLEELMHEGRYEYDVTPDMVAEGAVDP